MSQSFSYKNWNFQLYQSIIASENTLEKIKNQNKITEIPEMFFAESFLKISFEKKFSYTFSSLSALTKSPKLPTSYHQTKVKLREEKNRNLALSAPSLHGVINHVNKLDWTFSTCYKGDVAPDKLLIDSGTKEIDQNLISKKDPILWFASVVLFEDELHDNGVSRLSVKIRVMGDFFLCLMRLFVRVDDVLFRTHDTRIFHMFGSSLVHRVFKRSSSSFEEIQSKLKTKREELFKMNDDEINCHLDVLEIQNEEIRLRYED